MKTREEGEIALWSRPVNAVALRDAVLCADCDVVSDSPHDRCMVCGSRSLFNISRLLGGTLSDQRATLIEMEPAEQRLPEFVLGFPRPHRVRRKMSRN